MLNELLTFILVIQIAIAEETAVDLCDGENDWRCRNNQCIHIDYRCDGGLTCEDGTDEQNCVQEIKWEPQDKYEHIGKPMIKMKNEWRPICFLRWGVDDSAVFCRQLGWVTGWNKLGDKNPDKVWWYMPRCKGNETNIEKCPELLVARGYEGKKKCSFDLKIQCTTDVHLEDAWGKSIYRHGIVAVFQNFKWQRVCSDGFTDVEALHVCKKLGYGDGRAICCSAYQDTKVPGQWWYKKKLAIKCDKPGMNISDCIQNDVECASGLYASVICTVERIENEDYSVRLRWDQWDRGIVQVNRWGIIGQVCADGFGDTEATVFCRSTQRLLHGTSYPQFYKKKNVFPRFMSNVTCNGTEKSLVDCQFLGRLDMNGCPSVSVASVVCYNETGVEYRMMIDDVPSTENYGRVEVAVYGEWGSVCDRHWDDADADVFCRSLGENYTGGFAWDKAKYGPSDGQIWFNQVYCRGDEKFLHQCPHIGFFDSAYTRQNWYQKYEDYKCEHSQDASVFCIKDMKLNQPLDVNNGALMYNDGSGWKYVCAESIFERKEAKVACKGLLRGFVDGHPLVGQHFGAMEGPVALIEFSCTGEESTLSECSQTELSYCDSERYISVACSKEPLNVDDIGFEMRMGHDYFQSAEDNFGIIEVRDNGIWGRVCMEGFTDVDASVACKTLGYTGGNVYLHRYNSPLPMLWTHVTCTGSEESLEECDHSTDPDHQCHFDSAEAGVVCYKTEKITYRLTDGENDYQKGRVEIGYDGKFGVMCATKWYHMAARVFCRSLGFVDGLARHGIEPERRLQPMMGFAYCNGDEESLLTCYNSGLDRGISFSGNCKEHAYATCTEETIGITSIQIVHGDDRSGTLQIFVSGLNVWGFICGGYYWNHTDATVACRQLGFDEGIATTTKSYGSNQGSYLNALQCNGTEAHLMDCPSMGIALDYDCERDQRAGVNCRNHGEAYRGISPATPKRPATEWFPKKFIKNTDKNKNKDDGEDDAEEMKHHFMDPHRATPVFQPHVLKPPPFLNTPWTIAIVVTAVTFVLGTIGFCVYKYRGPIFGFIPHMRFHNEVEVVGENTTEAIVLQDIGPPAAATEGQTEDVTSEVKITSPEKITPTEQDTWV